MAKGYGIKKSNGVNSLATSTGALDFWPRNELKNASQLSAVTRRLKSIKVSLAPVPIKDSERSNIPLTDLINDPEQEWCLDELEQSLNKS